MKKLFVIFAMIAVFSRDALPMNNSPIHTLPEEVLSSIFDKLSINNLAVSKRVCKFWKHLASDKLLWETIALKSTATDETLRELAKQCPGLQSLDLNDCNKITDKGLSNIAANRPGLQLLYLDRCYRISDEGLANLFAHCPCLQSLILSHCDNLTDEAAISLAAHPSLQTVNFTWCHKLTDAATVTLATCPSLQSVNFTWCLNICPTAIEALQKARPDLEIISGQNIKF